VVINAKIIFFPSNLNNVKLSPFIDDYKTTGKEKNKRRSKAGMIIISDCRRNRRHHKNVAAIVFTQTSFH